MAETLSEEIVFSCSRQIMLREGECMVTFLGGNLRLKFPTTRKVADVLGVPHYYVLPFVAGLEEKGLLTRQERIGIFTTLEGTKRFFSEMNVDELHQAQDIFGAFLPKIFEMFDMAPPTA